MSDASSTHTSWTVKPRMSMPRIARACVLRLAAVGGELDAARLAAPADQHLRLDDAGIAELVGGGDRLLDGGGGRSPGHGNAAAGEQLLALILEQVHDARGL